MIPHAEIGFGSLAVEFGRINAKIGVGRCSIGDSLVFAAKIGEIRIVGVIAIENDDVWVHAEKVGFGVEVRFKIGVGEI